MASHSALFALFYDILITLGFQIAIIQENITFNYFVFLLSQGAIFTITHVISNFILFSLTKTIIRWVISAFQVRGIKQLLLPSFNNNIQNKKDIISNEEKK